jgi:CBS domain-containing protein
MQLGLANGDGDGLPLISGDLTVRDALSELIGAGSTRGVVEGENSDARRRLLTLDDIEKLTGTGNTRG